VEPIAATDRKVRADLREFVQSLTAEDWQRPSTFPGWTCRDVLAHLAGDSEKMFAYILSSVIDGKPLDSARVGPEAPVDDANARDVEARRGRSVDELLAEIEAEGENRQDLYAQLTDAHRNLRQAEYPITFGEYVSGNPGGHVREHLAQLRVALDGAR
jgi:uncharacterized protein (TIGR03083 family)